MVGGIFYFFYLLLSIKRLLFLYTSCELHESRDLYLYVKVSGDTYLKKGQNLWSTYRMPGIVLNALHVINAFHPTTAL